MGKMIDILLHFDAYLNVIVQACGSWTYLVLFAVIFAETGFVITPFLPGDSLLFVLGTFASRGIFHFAILAALLILAAILGDSVNYAVGKYLGNRLLHIRRFPIRKEHLDRAHHFYKKHGGKTIVLARFIPVIRTFAPFVAGVARMHYGAFLFYNVTGGIIWVLFLLGSGFYFGNIPFVKEHFSLVTLFIIFISILPGIIEFFRVKARGGAVRAPDAHVDV